MWFYIEQVYIGAGFPLRSCCFYSTIALCFSIIRSWCNRPQNQGTQVSLLHRNKIMQKLHLQCWIWRFITRPKKPTTSGSNLVLINKTYFLMTHVQFSFPDSLFNSCIQKMIFLYEWSFMLQVFLCLFLLGGRIDGFRALSGWMWWQRKIWVKIKAF
jgi:hypothetical protein